MEILENKTSIEERIFSIRGKQVILDRDLARLYGVEVAQMNRQVKRNMERFPDDFLFQLIREEWDALKCHFGISNSRGGDRSLPYAFTEQGVSMLAGLLRSPIAIEANIRIIRAFIALRKAVKDNELLLHRIERIEYRQSNSEFRIEELFNKIKENNDTTPVQGIFFDGQVYDAYVFVAGLVRKAARRIVLIEVRTFSKAHDRFLIIDDEVYLVGASIKDLGKKWFGFTLMENTDAEELIGRI